MTGWSAGKAIAMGMPARHAVRRCGRLRRDRRSRRPRGVALLFVLLLLSMTLVLGYAAVRSQNQVLHVQRNAALRARARQVAMCAMALGLQRMQSSSWQGVDTSLTGSLGSGETYLVTYVAGDAKLSASSADYAELPWRVTVTAHGYVTDPDNPQRITEQQAVAVMRLVPRRLSDVPSQWEAARKYAVYQWGPGVCQLEVPVRFGGLICLQSALTMAETIGWGDDVCQRYFTDLKSMKDAGQGDYRPLNARVTWSWGLQSSRTDYLVRTCLGISTTNQSPNYWSSFSFPTTATTYRLYPGGKQYTIPHLSGTISGRTLSADPATNPLGVYWSDGTIDVGDSTTIKGTLVVRGSLDDINFNGRNIRLSPMSLPALYGTTEAVQLPVGYADDIHVMPGADADVEGLLVCDDDFEWQSSAQSSTGFRLRGELMARDLFARARTGWYHTSTWWSSVLAAFNYQKDWVSGIRWFPLWLKQNYGLDYDPRLTTAQADPLPRYHWWDPRQGVYQPDPADGGLRWELLGSISQAQ